MEIIPDFKDVQRLLAGLQNQYTGYSFNRVGKASPTWDDFMDSMDFISPIHLIDV